MAESFRIVISPRAGREMQEIHEFVQGQSPQNATEVIERLLQGMNSLKTSPLRFKIERRVRKLGYTVHAMVVYPFIVYYRVIADEAIVRILCVQRVSKRRPRSFE